MAYNQYYFVLDSTFFFRGQVNKTEAGPRTKLLEAEANLASPWFELSKIH